MEYRQLGRAGLQVSAIGLGTNNFGRQLDAKATEVVINHALDMGMNMIDTANTYSGGRSEEFIGRALKGKRDKAIIATKVSSRVGDGPNMGGNSRQHILAEVENSLRRLGTDYIDLYQLHNPKMDALERDELFETLEQLQFEGKIRYYGVALGPDIGWVEEGEYSMRDRHVVSAQVIYSILEQDPAKGFMKLAEEHEVGLLSRVPHASNTLTGEFDHGLPIFDADDHRAHRKNEWLEEAMRKVDHVRFLVQEDTRTMAQSAIQFVLKQPTIVSVLPNFTNLAELKEYTSALDTPELTDEEQAKLDELWDHGFDIAEPEPQFREI